MRRRFHVIGLVIVLAGVVVAVLAGSSTAGRSTATVEIVSPPAGLTLPVGQAVEVRYRVLGAAARAELRCDETLLATDAMPAGRELAHAWIPAGPGAACCAVRVGGARNATLATARRCLTVAPDGSPVRLEGP